MKFAISNVCSAFDDETIGTKVLCGKEMFFDKISSFIAEHDFSKDRVPGQGFIHLPKEDFLFLISAGVGSRRTNPYDYVLRLHRGQVGMYLKRSYNQTIEGAALVIYTKEAYLADPDVSPEEVEPRDATHIIVAVLGFAGPKSPLSPDRFVHNLAGGNNEALLYSADEIREMAKEIKAYHDEWCVVAD